MFPLDHIDARWADRLCSVRPGGDDMSELDIEALREATEWIESFQVSIDPIVVRWSQALLAALEDRGRLMNGVKAVHNAVLAGGPDWMMNRDAALFDLIEILAALESRDG